MGEIIQKTEIFKVFLFCKKKNEAGILAKVIPTP